MKNQTLMQYFEWYLPHDGKHWERLASDSEYLAELGISHVWMPPAFKATNEKMSVMVSMTFLTSVNLTKKELCVPSTVLKKTIFKPFKHLNHMGFNLWLTSS